MLRSRRQGGRRLEARTRNAILGLHVAVRRRLLLHGLHNRPRHPLRAASGRHARRLHAMRRPVELVWAEEFQHIDDAIAAERRIKGWSRAKKKALIAGDWPAIQRLASRAKDKAG